jgi:hypothetical protein
MLMLHHLLKTSITENECVKSRSLLMLLQILAGNIVIMYLSDFQARSSDALAGLKSIMWQLRPLLDSASNSGY